MPTQKPTDTPTQEPTDTSATITPDGTDDEYGEYGDGEEPYGGVVQQ